MENPGERVLALAWKGAVAAGVSVLYGLPFASSHYTSLVKPHLIPVLLPITQVCNTNLIFW